MYSATPDDIDIIKTWPGGNGELLAIYNTMYLEELTCAPRYHLRQGPYRDWL